MELKFVWERAGAYSYWSDLWYTRVANEAGMCVLKSSVDKQYYISGGSVGYPSCKDLGPYRTKEEAMAVVELLVSLSCALTIDGELRHGA